MALDASASRARVLIAPDSFKGTFAANEVAEAIGEGVRRAGLEADLCPAADGGEGTLEALTRRHGARWCTAEVHDPLGRLIRADFALIDGGTVAVVESVRASGLGLVGPAERDAVSATSAGTGELILAAVRAGAKRIRVGLGGTATSDGGRGAVVALEAGGGLSGARLELLCDVETPFERAAEVFGPQKGADQAGVAELTRLLHQTAQVLPRDPRGVPRTGAAGGLAGALWAAYDATLLSGAATVLDAVEFDRRLLGATAVITGEGMADAATFEGKLAGEVLRRAELIGRPTFLVAGCSRLPMAARSRFAGVREATTLADMSSVAYDIASPITVNG